MISVILLCVLSLLNGSLLARKPPFFFDDVDEKRKEDFLPQTYSVFYEQGSWIVRPGTGGVAVATYDIQQTTKGWDYLKITTDKTQTDSVQAYAAGFIEGAITYQSIYDSWLTNNSTQTTEVESFVLAQDSWIRTQAKSLGSTSQYWAQVGLILSQLDGIIAGYAQAAPKEQQLSYLQMLCLQLGPEIGDIMTHLQLKTGSFKEENRFEQHYKIGSHCSVLIKLSSDGQRLFAAHDTWSSFTSMLRVYKTYQFNFNLPSNNAPVVSFSSYPGSISSSDDFYITSAKLVVMETTNEVMNNSLFLDYISTSTVPEWIRVVVANRMSLTGDQWAPTYSMYNSGTYNNQWQIVDYKLFFPGLPLNLGTLFIVEQIPGFVVYQDMTPFLSSNKYWPSYNIPYFTEIYDLSDYPAYYEKYGNVFSYENCARAQIFRRDAPAVETVDQMKSIMRYNEYQTDPLSLQDACRGISARCDLNAPWNNDTLNPYSAFGAIDSKVTSHNLVPNLQAWVVAGPTWDSQPPFAWTGQWKGVPHYGQAQIFDFEFEITP